MTEMQTAHVAHLPTLCRDCLTAVAAADPVRRCPACGSPRLLAHAELHHLAIAHLDCDAFYASVEKRDRPELRDRPVVVGGGHRGVVAAACYVARIYGVRSAMPMFKALRACPDAVVIKPDMAKYAAAGRQVRALMSQVTPLVQPLSIDEAFMDLSGNDQPRDTSPAVSLVTLAQRIEREIGVTVSIGLSHNKFLAKLASDMDKPRGFAVIGRAETLDVLGPRPVGDIWGVGRSLQDRLRRDGIGTIADLRERRRDWLVGRYGRIGHRLYLFARGQDDRTVDPHADVKSVSSETTFDTDIADLPALESELRPLCEAVARRLTARDLAGHTIVLKLKTIRFRTLTRSHSLPAPTRLAERIYREGAALLEAAADAGPFRLIGIGVSDLAEAAAADPPDLLDPGQNRQLRLDATLRHVNATHPTAPVTRGGDGLVKKPRRDR